MGEGGPESIPRSRFRALLRVPLSSPLAPLPAAPLVFAALPHNRRLGRPEALEWSIRLQGDNGRPEALER